MKLKTLLNGVEFTDISGNTNKEISHVSNTSSEVSKDSLFVAIKGLSNDGHAYISEVIGKGCIAVVYESELPRGALNKKVTFIKVPSSRKALATLTSNYYDNPEKKLKLVGITGTNGKTTTCELTYQLLKNSGAKVGLISTVSAKIGEGEIDTGYHVTSPEPLDLHKYLRKMVDKGCKYAVVEVTSHGIDQFRTHGLSFEVCAITNITPEHLDYHKTLDSYIKTKAKIFEQSKKIILNKYDPSINKLKELIIEKGNTQIVDYKKLVPPKDFSDKFPGQHNLENLSIAYEITKILLGKVPETSLDSLLPVTGRMEQVSNNKGFKIIIDFAHDATSLEKALQVARTQTAGRLISVFGCAGLRDKTKRSKMGMVAGKLADKIVITAEDPRTEDLNKINRTIESGLTKAKRKTDKDYFIIPDRQEAISFAIRNLAKKGDLILITGKGHEKSMCFGTTEYPWSDRGAVKKALKSGIPASDII